MASATRPPTWPRCGTGWTDWGPTRILVVVGAPQAQHLAMVVAVARMAGWLPDDVSMEHVAFGNVLGTDHKLLKSRAGDAVKLVELLDEAIERARVAMVAGRRHRCRGGRRGGPAVGIGGVKYADLSTERLRDYVFDWDRMLASEGNTGPYLQYAHARICSIFRAVRPDRPRRGRCRPGWPTPTSGPWGSPCSGSPGALEAALETYSPSKLCAYLFQLATTFTSFYENCPVLRAPDEVTRDSRLVLCDLTARVLAEGLGLLGSPRPPTCSAPWARVPPAQEISNHSDLWLTRTASDL